MSQSTESAFNTNQSAGVIGQAQQWLRQGSVGQMLGRVPASLKNVSAKGTARFKNMSTTQKVVGGTLLALGAGYLATRKGSSAAKAKSTGSVATLQELLLFVNDRIEGYKRAVDESHDPELRSYYKQLVSQSQQFSADLNSHLTREGGERETGTTLKGKFYRVFMDTKAAATGNDEKAILGSNVFGEEWAMKAYKEALTDQTLRGTLRQAVQRQYDMSEKTYNRLKGLEGKQ